MKQRYLHNTGTNKAPLYRHVFFGVLSRLVVFLLLISFVMQPAQRVHGNTETETSTPVTIDTSLVVPTVTLEDTLGTAPVESEVQIPVDNAFSSFPNPQIETLDTLPVITEDTLSGTLSTATSSTLALNNFSATTSDNSVASDTENLPEAVAPTTTVVTVESDADTKGDAPLTDMYATSTVVSDQKLFITDSATTTDQFMTEATTSGEVLEAKASISGGSLLQFEKRDCVAVSDGSYYCKTNVLETDSLIKNGLYSKPDIDGDLEIFFAHDGILDQVTFNQVDDSAPYFDSISNTIVWHRLINDRYQIMSFDVRSGAESQLTTDTVNNMEPTRAANFTAWQHWNGDNWDILVHDGATTKRITSVPEHDIAPKIRGNLVMWHRLSLDTSQTIELYDLTTGEYTSIADDEGGELSNPRMVLVYDAQFENGDIITKGYDVDSREISELTAIPVKIPDSLPAPDTTGETRALIQIKSTSRDDSEVITTAPTIDPPDPDLGTTTISSSSLQVGEFDPPVAPTASSVTPEMFTLDLSASSSLEFTDADVIVPSFVMTSSTPVEP